MNRIEPKSGAGFKLNKGELLKIIDIEGEQVSDLFCISRDDSSEHISSGRTIDYLSRITFKEGDTLYSNKSRPMLSIVEDKVGVHDFLLTPCSKETFKIIYNDSDPCCGCEGNLSNSFAEFGFDIEAFPPAFNVFMNVKISSSGSLKVLPPLSRAGDYIIFKAERDLYVGLTACSALESNNGSFKPIGYDIIVNEEL